MSPQDYIYPFIIIVFFIFGWLIGNYLFFEDIEEKEVEQVEVCDEIIYYTYRGGRPHQLCYQEDKPYQEYTSYQREVIIQWKKQRLTETGR